MDIQTADFLPGMLLGEIVKKLSTMAVPDPDQRLKLMMLSAVRIAFTSSCFLFIQSLCQANHTILFCLIPLMCSCSTARHHGSRSSGQSECVQRKTATLCLLSYN